MPGILSWLLFAIPTTCGLRAARLQALTADVNPRQRCTDGLINVQNLSLDGQFLDSRFRLEAPCPHGANLQRDPREVGRVTPCAPSASSCPAFAGGEDIAFDVFDSILASSAIRTTCGLRAAHLQILTPTRQSNKRSRRRRYRANFPGCSLLKDVRSSMMSRSHLHLDDHDDLLGHFPHHRC